MKRIYPLLVILMLFTSMTVHAGSILDDCQDAMYFRTVKTDSPNNVELSLCLKNSSFAIKSLQCTVVLPQGVSFVTEGSGYKITKNDVIDSNWTLIARHKIGDQDNSAIVLLYNDSNTDQIATGNRKVASIPLVLNTPDALNGTGIYIKDVTLTGADLKEYSGESYAFNFYTLTYLVDSVEYKTEDLKAGDAIIPTAAPTREGYTFSGWSEIPSTMPSSDVEISGTFSVNSYNLVYTVDGETYKSLSVEYGSSITAEPEPTKEGSTFSGWSGIPATMPARDVEITGSFDSNSYKLIYKLDGDIYKSSIVKYGSEITAEPAPVKEGYTFSGWSEIPSTMPASDVEITGTFSVNSYNLVYKVDGSTYKTMSVVYGSEIIPEAAPTKEGYTFSGWSEIPATMPSSDVEITGTFSVNSYNLVYIVDGETYKSLSVEYGDSIIAEPEPTKEGYTFSGWSYIPETMPAEDVEITGLFRINMYSITYLVDDTLYSQDSVEYGAVITLIEEPLHEGLTFSGWISTVETMPSHDVVISGTFTPNVYQLAVMVDDEVVYSDSIAYGTMLSGYIDLITQQGFDISQWEWYDKIETITMPAHDVIINAVLSAVRPIVSDLDNDVIYDLNGRVIKVDDILTLPSGIYIRNGRKIVIQYE